MTSYRFTSSALAEVKKATLYYEYKENGLGEIFLNELDAAIARVLSNPLAWHPLSTRTRRCRTHRFPFGLIYQKSSAEILILSVMDRRRDPSSWKSFL